MIRKVFEAEQHGVSRRRKAGVSRYALIAAGGVALGLLASAGTASAQSTCSGINTGGMTGDGDQDQSQTACGSYATTIRSADTVAVGTGSSAQNGVGHIAVGGLADASGTTPGGLGSWLNDPNQSYTTRANTVVGYRSTGVGDDAGNTVVGSFANSSGHGSTNVALGTGAMSYGTGSTNIAIGGATATGDGTSNIAIGDTSRAQGRNSVAMGYNARALNDFSVAIGAGSVADANNTVSFGTAANQRRLTNIADGVNASDAATVRQVQAVTAQAVAQANAYADAGDAATLMAANQNAYSYAVSALNGAIDYADQGDARTLADANAYSDAGDAATLTAANTYADAGDAATLAAANTYADEGDVRTLASANTYADAGDVRTLASANAYADAGDIRTLGAANFYTDQQFTRLETVMNGRFRDVEIRMDQVTAMSAAFAVMAGNNAGAGTGSANRLVVGVGNYGSETAMSVGYSRTISNRTAFNAGVSFTGGEVMSGGSFGFAW